MKASQDGFERLLFHTKLWAYFLTCTEYMTIDEAFDIQKSITNENEFDLNQITGFSYDDTISFYELICWFNQQYRSFIKEASKLTQLETTFKNEDTGKMMTRRFVFDSVPRNTIFGTESKMIFHEDFARYKSWADPTCRQLIISSDIDVQKFGKTVICDHNRFDRTQGNYTFVRTQSCNIDDGLLDAYLEIRNKYYNFLRVYTILKDFNLDAGKWYATYIDAPNPFKKINSIKLFLCGSTNESNYMATYKFGGKYPLFCGNNIGPHRFYHNIEDLTYDYIPKKARIRRNHFDVDIDTSNVDFPILNVEDKKLIYIPNRR